MKITWANPPPPFGGRSSFGLWSISDNSCRFCCWCCSLPQACRMKWARHAILAHFMNRIDAIFGACSHFASSANFLLGLFVFGVRQASAGADRSMRSNCSACSHRLRSTHRLASVHVRALDYAIPVAIMIFYLVLYWNQALAA
jgi:hypothetical protein